MRLPPATAATALAVFLAAPALVTLSNPQHRSMVPDSLTQRAQADESVRVIVQLEVAPRPEGNLAAASQTAQRVAIASAQAELLAALPPAGYHVTRQFSTIPFIALEVDPIALGVLGSVRGVRGITEDALARGLLAESVPLVNAPQAWAAGYDGTGWSVAVLDSGIDTTHPFLANKVIEEACFTTAISASSAGYCPNGQTTQLGPGAGVNCTYAPRGCSHGTPVAGIVAGAGPSMSGVAKGASLISVQVFSHGGTNCWFVGEYPCAMSHASDQIAGLEYVYGLRSAHAIASVNISAGFYDGSRGQYTTQAACDAANAPMKAAIDNLRSAGIATVVSAGNGGYNGGYSDSLEAPACISSAISVGSTTKWDAVSAQSNSASFLSLLAPGESITSAVPGGAFSAFSGTSMAAPHVAGAWAIAKQHDPTASVTDLLTAFRNSSTWITDARNGLTFPRLDVAAAIGVPAPPRPGGFVKIAPVSGAATPPASLTLSWSESSGGDRYEYCYDTSNDNACSTWIDNGSSTTAALGAVTPAIYYWQVRAINLNGMTYGDGAAASFAMFTTQPPWPFGKIAPANGAGTPETTSAVLKWSGSAGATSYEYCYDTTNDNVCSSWQSRDGRARSQSLVGLKAGTTYYWQVRAVNALGVVSSDDGAFWRFTTTGGTPPPPPPGAFTKTAPANGSVLPFVRPGMRWSASSSSTALQYEYCVDATNDNACSSWSNVGALLFVYDWGLGLHPNTTYYWQVRASNAGGQTYADGAPTAFSSFTTGIRVPVILWSADNDASIMSLTGAYPTGLSSPGPGPSWTPQSYARDPDESFYVLWTTDNAAQLWHRNPDNSWRDALGFSGPGPGWTATSYFHHADDSYQLLWTADNQAQLWTVNADGTWGGCIGAIGPGAGWRATSYTQASDGSHRILWTADNQAQVWTVTAELGWGGAIGLGGPAPGWRATSYELDDDGRQHVLWTTEGAAQLWNLTADNGWDGMSGYLFPARTAESYSR